MSGDTRWGSAAKADQDSRASAGTADRSVLEGPDDHHTSLLDVSRSERFARLPGIRSEGRRDALPLDGESAAESLVGAGGTRSAGSSAASPQDGESLVGAVAGPRRRTLGPVLGTLAVLLAGSVVVAVGIGTVAVPVTHTWAFLRAGLFGGTIGLDDVGEYRIIWDLRLPRVLLAAVVGAGLATVGVAIQAMVRNALAEPYVLGISSGASVGAAAVTLFGVFASLGIYALSAGAFVAALGATLIVYVVARTRQGLAPLRLVLTGTTLSYGFFAITTVIVFQAPNGEAARSALFWLLGSLAGANWGTLPVAAIVVGGGALLLWALSGRLNALAMGDEAATTLGVDVGKLRILLFVVCAAMTGVLVAVSGAIGFVGLVLPHLVRLVVGGTTAECLPSLRSPVPSSWCGWTSPRGFLPRPRNCRSVCSPRRWACQRSSS